MTQHDLPPDSADELVAELGRVDAEKVIAALGGLSFMPPTAKGARDSEFWPLLVERLGDELAHRLIDRYGGLPLFVPKCQRQSNAARNAEMISAYEASCRAGLPVRLAVADLCIRYKMTGCMVSRIVNG